MRRARRARDFVMEQLGGGVGATAVSAGLAGMGGAAIAIATLDSTEKADFVEFTLDGEPVRGWFWRFPFDEGDDIELVAEHDGQVWTAYGARRPADALVAVYPHCFEGRRAHYASTFRFWGIVVAAVFLFMMCLDAILSMFKGTFSLTGQLSAYAVYLAYGLPALLLVFDSWPGGAVARRRGLRGWRSLFLPALAGRTSAASICARRPGRCVATVMDAITARFIFAMGEAIVPATRLQRPLESGASDR
ncbi:putative type VI secretion system effector [Achromobacter xylosoxidans]